ncbi:hypothetical protein F8E02_10700 [Methanoculleus sp. Wushi-C6]|uniref:Uncharacterized protein n=1 Tax=Methanoculleus caldifontis TaxID=2651577 RepID=A0ABU3X319_9EURY|nr:hypothetical protein [Methanoculleus sp. Wushi-C6]
MRIRLPRRGGGRRTRAGRPGRRRRLRPGRARRRHRRGRRGSCQAGGHSARSRCRGGPAIRTGARPLRRRRTRDPGVGDRGGRL